MKKHLLLLITAILLFFVSCEIFNPSPDPKQDQDPPASQIINATEISVNPTTLLWIVEILKTDLCNYSGRCY